MLQERIRTQFHEPPFLLFWKLRAKVVHYGFDFSSKVYRATGIRPFVLAIFAKGSVLFTAPNIIAVNCV
jgi:hypothetical protein